MEPSTLFEEHRRLAAAIALEAYRRQNRKRSGCTFDDLHGAALVGLWKATERFDPERGVQFSTYAGRIMRGTVVDWIRSTAVGGPGMARKGRTPGVISLDAEAAGLTARQCPCQVEQREIVEEAMSRLKPQTRQSLRLCFLEGLLQREAAVRLGVSQSRMSQVVSDGLRHLREALAHRRAEFMES